MFKHFSNFNQILFSVLYSIVILCSIIIMYNIV